MTSPSPPTARSGSPIRSTASAVTMKASRSSPSRKSTTSTASIRNPATSKLSWMTLWSPTASPFHPMRRSSTSSTRLHRWSGQPVTYPRLRRRCRSREGFERQSVCRDAQTQHYRRHARRYRRQYLVLDGLGRPERGRRPLLQLSRRAAWEDPHSGDCRQSVLRRHVPEPALHLRLDIALCRLYQRDGRNEALIGQGCVLFGEATRPAWLS